MQDNIFSSVCRDGGAADMERLDRKVTRSYDLLGEIRHSIEEEMMRYSEEVQKELQHKYAAELETLLRKHRRNVVLDVMEKLKIDQSYDPIGMQNNITIKF